jgi:hypothetical protein
MLLIKLSFVVLIFFGSENDTDKIVVIGTAKNYKAGAAVISDLDSTQYYVDGVDYWKDHVVGKRIQVKGKLLVKEHLPPPPGEIKQGIVEKHATS